MRSPQRKPRELQAVASIHQVNRQAVSHLTVSSLSVIFVRDKVDDKDCHPPKTATVKFAIYYIYRPHFYKGYIIE